MGVVPQKVSLDPRVKLERMISIFERSISTQEKLRKDKPIFPVILPIIDYFLKESEAFESAKFLVKKSREAYQRGEDKRALDLMTRGRGVLDRYDVEYAKYYDSLIRPWINSGVAVAKFMHEFGEMGFKVSVVGLAGALAAPVVGGAAAGGAAVGGPSALAALKTWFVTSLGGASAYGIASSLKRGLYSLIDGEKMSIDRFASQVLNQQQMDKDFWSGMFAASGMYFIPHAAAHGEMLAAGMRGIKQPLMSLLPISTVQGVHGGAEMMAAGGTPLEIGAATVMGFTLPYVFKGVEAGLSLPQTIKAARLQTAAVQAEAPTSNRAQGKTKGMNTVEPNIPSSNPQHMNHGQTRPNGTHPMEASPFRQNSSTTPYPVEEIKGHEMIRIPGGPMVVGAHDFANEYPHTPPHWVNLSPFWVSRTAVTEGQFRSVLGRPGRAAAPENHPVTEVDYKAANDYCLKLGLQLLTSAQHECASRGPALKILKRPEVTVKRFAERTDGLENFVTKLEMGAKIYTATDPALHKHLDQGHPVYAWRKYSTRSGRPDESWGRPRSIAPADSGLKNGYGLKGLGNVWEWCQDYYKKIKPWPLWVQKWMPWVKKEGADYYRPPANDPKGPQVGDEDGSRVVRGGSWYGPLLRLFRSAYRDNYPPDYHDDLQGFRVGAAAAPQLQGVNDL